MTYWKKNCKSFFTRFQKVFGLPSSHSQKLEIIPFYSHFPFNARPACSTCSSISFCSIWSNRKLRVWDFFVTKTWVVSSCLLTDLSPSPPQKKKVEGFSPKPSWHFLEEKNHIPPSTRKTKRCVAALPFLGEGPFPLAMVDVRQPGFVKPRFFFVGEKAQWVGFPKAINRWEKGNAWMSRWKLDVKG